MLDPSDLRDLASAISYGCTWRPEWMNGLVTQLSEEAARREAEQKPTGRRTCPVDGCICTDPKCGPAGETCVDRPPQVEREGLDSADAELVKHLRMLASIRAIPGPGSLGVEGDPAWKAADRIDTLKARVAELEKERGNIHASYEAERRMHHAAGDKLARLSAALKRIGKTYGANYARLIHSETQIKEIVEAALAEAGHGK